MLGVVNGERRIVGGLVWGRGAWAGVSSCFSRFGRSKLVRFCLPVLIAHCSSEAVELSRVERPCYRVAMSAL